MSQAHRHADEADQQDALKHYRQQFNWPTSATDHDITYLCGNSLGLQPHAAVDRVLEVMNDWATLGVEGHFKAKRSWLHYHQQAAPLLARLLGCNEDEVVAMNTLTVNLNLLLLSFYRPTPERFKILIEADAFPSDRYAVQSQLAYHGHDAADAIVDWHADDTGLHADALDALLKQHPEIALVLLPGIQYLSGEWLDLESIAAVTKAHDVVLGLDLAHAVGNVPINLSAYDADFAVFCTYKYLNGGPGSIGGAYVNQRHHGSDVPRLHGWWGNDESSRFLMSNTFDPAKGVDVWQQSNPPILSLAPVIASLEMFDEVGMSALREKSLALTGFLHELIDTQLSDHIDIVTPADPARRGAQLSLALKAPAEAGRRLFSSLEAAGIIGDWREPNIIRVAPAPLYNNHADVIRLVDALHQAIAEK
ncbi:MAG: kynureninase [Woeseiaceae bacterium]